MSLSGFRGWLYRLAKLLGDVNAIEKGQVPRRLVRQVAGKLTGRLLGRLFRAVALALLVAGPGWAGERGGREAVVPDGGRVVQQGERLDVYDRQSNRIGYGYIRGDGSVDLYHMDGSRKATIQRGPSGEMRVTVPRRAKP